MEATRAALETANLWTAWIQLGFAGLCLILMAFVGWLVRAVIRQSSHTTTAMVQVSTTIQSNTDAMRSMEVSVQRLTDRLPPLR